MFQARTRTRAPPTPAARHLPARPRKALGASKHHEPIQKVREQVERIFKGVLRAVVVRWFVSFSLQEQRVGVVRVLAVICSQVHAAEGTVFFCLGYLPPA